MPLTRYVSGHGSDTCDFNGQLAVKSSVNMSVAKEGRGGTASITGYPAGAEVTQEDGTVTVSAVNYRWACAEAIPDSWVNAGSMGGDPYYQNSYTVMVPGKPGGAVTITITWQTYTVPPKPPEVIPPTEEIPSNISDTNIVTDPPSSPITSTEWITQKVILDEGLWVTVVDDYDQEKHLVSRHPDIIDLLVADEDDAERIGQDIIWESSRKRSGYISVGFNPFFVPGKFFETALSSQHIYMLIARMRRIEWRQAKGLQQTRLHIKERGREDE
jgi:hypothetical protein